MNLQELLGFSDTFWNFCQIVAGFHFLFLPIYIKNIFMIIMGRTDEQPTTKPNPLNRKS